MKNSGKKKIRLDLAKPEDLIILFENFSIGQYTWGQVP